MGYPGTVGEEPEGELAAAIPKENVEKSATVIVAVCRMLLIAISNPVFTQKFVVLLKVMKFKEDPSNPL